MSTAPKSPRSPRAASPSKNAGSGSPKATSPNNIALLNSHHSGAQAWLYCAALGAGFVVPLYAPEMIYADAAKYVPNLNVFALNHGIQGNSENAAHSFAVLTSLSILALANLVGLLKQCPGSMGIFMASIANLVFVAKSFLQTYLYPQQQWNTSPHWLFIALALLGFVLAAYSHFVSKHSKLGLHLFLGSNAVQMLAMFFMPLAYFQIFFPHGHSLPAPTAALVREFACLIGTVALANVLSSCPGAMGRSMATAVLLIHLLSDCFTTKMTSALIFLPTVLAAFAVNAFALYQQHQAKSKPNVKKA